jgi:hypothetical protein
VYTRWIKDGGRQHIGRCPGRAPFVLGDSAIAPVNRNADLVRLLPLIIMGLIRWVTIALAIYSLRALDTLKRSPPLIPISSASSTGTSTNGSGTSSTLAGLFLVQ